MRPNRARMGDTLLSELVLLRCNNAMYLDVLYADSVFVCCLHCVDTNSCCVWRQWSPCHTYDKYVFGIE